MKRTAIALFILLFISLYFNLKLWRINTLLVENNNIRQEKLESDFHRTRAARAAMFKQLPLDTASIVFVGNSLTEMFPVTDYFNDIHVRNRGISGNTSDDIKALLPDIIKYHPQKIFLDMGINDLKYGLGNIQKTEQNLFSNYRWVLNTIHTQSPETRVYIQNILPVNKMYNPYQADSVNKIIAECNPVIQNIARQYNDQYIDLYTQFVENGHLPEKYTVDGVHLNEKGYAIWYNFVKKYVH